MGAAPGPTERTTEGEKGTFIIFPPENDECPLFLPFSSLLFLRAGIILRRA
jgi:hypothetical protein